MPERLNRRLARIQQVLAGAEEAMTYTGDATAALYIAGARGNVRIALDRRSSLASGEARCCNLPWLACRLVANSSEGRLSHREPMKALTRSSSPRLAGAHTLSVDILFDRKIRRLARDAAFAALLADALSQHRWLHLSSGAIWNGGHLAARAVVQLICGRNPLQILGPWETSGLLDEQIAAELLRLGWTWLESPTLPF